MPQLAIARPEQIDEVYRESHSLWGAGLAYDDYRGLWRDVSRTAWARLWVRFYVWTDDDGRVLSSMKLYRPLLSRFGEITRAAVIGAVFTPAALRRRGYAAEMVRAAVAAAAERGESLVMLFSDIGTGYYSSFGFRALPAEEHFGRLPPPRPAPGWELCEKRDDDLESIALAHDDFCKSRPIAVMRDAEHWHYLWVRSQRFFERSGDPRIRQHYRIALDRGRFAGYLITVEGGEEWDVREVGASDGDPARMATILRLGAAAAWRDGLRSFYGWLPPPALRHLDDWAVRSRRRRRALPMVRTMAGEIERSLLRSPKAAYLPFQDQF